MRALARRDHSSASVRAKLERAGVDEATRKDVVDTLVRAGDLDDARFAHARAEHLVGRGYGDAWIRADLERQGVPREVVEETMAALPAERERALLDAARLRDPLRAARTLARRGFSAEAVEAVLARVVADDGRPGVG